jgi:hypothetical protein
MRSLASWRKVAVLSGPEQPAILDESIYSAFALQEAVRLAERATKHRSQHVLSMQVHLIPYLLL